jgi:N-acetylmuramoyl-L-alanine amidase
MFRIEYMKLIPAAVVSVALLGAQTGKPLESVTAIRHWSLGEVTRVAIEVSGEFEFRTDRLHNPERIYFDIPKAKPKLDGRRIYTQEWGDKLVARVRVAETTPGVTRVVLDLSAAVEATSSQLANPNRLIVELKAAAANASPIEAQQPPPANIAPLKTEVPPVVSKVTPAPKPVEPPVRADVLEKPATLPDATARAVAVASTIKPARRTSGGETSLVRALGLKVGRVVIDAGHGGHDQGTESPKGLLEKDLVLDVALRVGKLVEERMGAEVIYTRSDDTFIPLEGRTALANEKKADLFLSIHANSSPFPRAGGVETYYLNFADSKEAMDVASRENASSQKSVFELRDIISKITQHDKAEESKEFAAKVQASLQSFSARNFPGIRNRGVKKAPFVVLVGASMPSVLAEIGFLSNPREEALLKKPDHRQKLAEALFKGLQGYATSLSHFQIAQAKE